MGHRQEPSPALRATTPSASSPVSPSATCDHHRRRAPSRPDRAEGGDCPMTSILYDEPGSAGQAAGPDRHRHRVRGDACAVWWSPGAAAGRPGPVSMELWGPFINPGRELRAGVAADRPGLRATLKHAVLAILLSLVIGTLVGSARMMLGRVARAAARGADRAVPGAAGHRDDLLRLHTDPIAGARHLRAARRGRLWFVVIGLTLYNSVIIAEILRAGVASLPTRAGGGGAGHRDDAATGDGDRVAAAGVPHHAARADQPAAWSS